MATIVEDTTTGQRLVLVGAGFGMYSSTSGHALFGDLAPNTNAGGQSSVCVTNESGLLGWIDSRNIRVISVDGKAPGQLLQPSDA